MIKKLFFGLMLIQSVLLSNYNNYFQSPPADTDNKLDFVKLLYNGNAFLSKEEFNTVSAEIQKIKKINTNKGTNFILLFNSTSVPKTYLEHILTEVGVLQENNMSISAKQLYIGISDKTMSYIDAIRKDTEDFDQPKRKFVIDNFAFKLAPDLFHDLNITKAPALAYAKCKGSYVDSESCKIFFLARGTVSVSEFFSMISSKNQAFEKYTRALHANRIENINEHKRSKNEQENK